jgi:hypothetical protein
MTVLTENGAGEVCVAPPLEDYMAVPVKQSCSEIAPGIKFKNPVDGFHWTINTVDQGKNIIDSVTAGTSYYLMIAGRGRWGIGYMPHLYAPGDYSDVAMTWEQSWSGGPSYTGKARGDIFHLDTIASRNPLQDYKPNLVMKTKNFAGATGDNTLIVAQEQIFPGWWGGPWTEPDGEVVEWTFGPFVSEGPSDFILRILMTPVSIDTLYIADYTFAVCKDGECKK